MKATGVVRRIDELGRIVIPKELRKNLRIKEGENLEIYTVDDEKIVLKKFSSIKGIGDIADYVVQAICSTCKHNTLIYDSDNIIAFSGKGRKDYLDKKLGRTLVNYLNENSDNEKIEIAFGKEEECYILNEVIRRDGDIIGGIMVMSDEKIDDDIGKILNSFSVFLSKYLD